MTKVLEEGKSYVMNNGEVTGPLYATGYGRFKSHTVQAIGPSGASVGPQVWNPNGSVYSGSLEEIKQHTINLANPVELPKRWEALVTYRLANGFYDLAKIDFEEFEELGSVIEGGRDFHTIESIEVRLNVENLERMFKRG